MTRLAVTAVATTILISAGVIFTADAQEETKAQPEREQRDDERSEREERSDKDREQDDRRQRENTEHELAEFERHRQAMRREIAELRKAGKADRAAEVEQALRKQIEEFGRHRRNRGSESDEVHGRLEHIHRAVQFLREAAEHLHIAGFDEPAEHVAEFSKEIAQNAPRQLQEGHDRSVDEERRGDHDEESDHNEGNRSDKREHNQKIEEVIDRHTIRLNELEEQLHDVRLMLRSLQSRRDKEGE